MSVHDLPVGEESAKAVDEIVEVADEGDRASVLYDRVMLVLIFLSLLPMAFKGEYTVLTVIDRGCAVCFLADYVLRLITADFKYGPGKALSFLRYPVSGMGIIDLLSIIPSFTVVNNSFKALRIVRGARLLRVFKAARHSKSIKTIMAVFWKAKDALYTVCLIAVLYVLVSALVIINLEPESFSSYFEAVYWAVISLTTMGYGDIYPVTVVGRIFTMISAAFGIAIIALPAGIITAAYMNEMREAEEAPEEAEEKGPEGEAEQRED